MSKTTNLNVRVDEELKHQAEAVFSEIGMNLSTAINVFLRSSVRYEGIPFELRTFKKPVSIEEISDEELEEILRDRIALSGNGKGKPADEFFDELERELGIGEI